MKISGKLLVTGILILSVYGWPAIARPAEGAPSDASPSDSQQREKLWKQLDEETTVDADSPQVGHSPDGLRPAPPPPPPRVKCRPPVMSREDGDDDENAESGSGHSVIEDAGCGGGGGVRGSREDTLNNSQGKDRDKAPPASETENPKDGD